MLDNSNGEAFTDAPYFNQNYIKANHIKRISGFFTHKKMGDVLRETALKREYLFDTLGKLIQKYETVEAKNGYDTLVTQYEYTSNGLLEIIRKSDQFGFNAVHYTYDSLGRVIREEIRRHLNQNGSRVRFNLSEEYLVTFETSSYENYARQQKRIFYNNYNQPYREEITYLDESGSITSRLDRLLRTSGTKKTEYFYNEKNWIDSIQVFNNQTGNKNSAFSFIYDNYGNLDTKNTFDKGIHTTQIQLIYDKKTMRLDYILSREVATNYMTILKLDNYEKYD
ncbi:MAG: hypothetical protein ACPGU5_03125 [Lishizhenia sp.]